MTAAEILTFIFSFRIYITHSFLFDFSLCERKKLETFILKLREELNEWYFVVHGL